MKRFLTLCLVLVSCACVSVYAQKGLPKHQQDWAKFYRYEKLNAEVLASGVRPDAVFMGNSITQNWAKYNPDFFKNNNFVGRGIGGQTTSHMLVRFRRDVIELNPRAVVIMAGINDIALNNGHIALEDVLGNIISMCEIAKANRIKPVICSVLPCKKYGWRPEVTDAGEQIVKLNAMLQAYAKENKIPYVDYHSVMKDSENGLPASLAKDGCHPTPEGYEIMEEILLKTLK